MLVLKDILYDGAPYFVYPYDREVVNEIIEAFPLSIVKTLGEREPLKYSDVFIDSIIPQVYENFIWILTDRIPEQMLYKIRSSYVDYRLKNGSIPGTRNYSDIHTVIHTRRYLVDKISSGLWFGLQWFTPMDMLFVLPKQELNKGQKTIFKRNAETSMSTIGDDGMRERIYKKWIKKFPVRKAPKDAFEILERYFDKMHFRIAGQLAGVEYYLETEKFVLGHTFCWDEHFSLFSPGIYARLSMPNAFGKPYTCGGGSYEYKAHLYRTVKEI